MKFLVLVADGNETIEIFTVVDYLRRAGIEIDMASTKDGLDLVTSHGIAYKADIVFDDIDKDEYGGVYIPGGTQGAESLRDDERVIDLVRDFDKEEKTIAAICAGPIVLDRAGVLEKRRATSFPTIKDELKNVGAYVDDEIVVTDGHITTSRGAALTNYLALRLVDIIKGHEAKNEVKEAVQQDKVERYFGRNF